MGVPIEKKYAAISRKSIDNEYGSAAYGGSDFDWSVTPQTQAGVKARELKSAMERAQEREAGKAKAQVLTDIANSWGDKPANPYSGLWDAYQAQQAKQKEENFQKYSGHAPLTRFSAMDSIFTEPQKQEIAQKKQAAMKTFTESAKNMPKLRKNPLGLVFSETPDGIIERQEQANERRSTWLDDYYQRKYKDEYGIDTKTFDFKDLDKWALGHHYEFNLRKQSNTESSYLPQKGITKQEENDFRILSRIARINSERKQAEDIGKEHPVAGSTLTVAAAPLRAITNGLALIDDYKRIMTGKGVDVNSQYRGLSNFTNRLRQTVAEEHASKWFGGAEGNVVGDYGEFLYNTLMSAGDSGMNMLVGEGLGMPKLTAGLMSVDSAARSVVSNKARGLGDVRSVLLGTASGLIEAATEKFSIDEIMKQPKNLLSAALKSFAAEGSEEIASNALNKALDAIVNLDEGEISVSIRKYMEAGMNKKEATARAIADSLLEDLAAGLAGGVSGIAMGGAVRGLNTAQDIHEAGEYKKDGGIPGLIESGLESPEGTKSRIQAEKLAQKQADGKHISNRDVATLIRENQNQIDLEERGMQETEPQEVRGRDLREVFGLKQTAAQGDINAQTAQPKDMETIKREYAQAVDPNIVAFAQYAVSNPGDNKSAVRLGDVSERQAADIKNLTGIDTKGFGTEAKANTFRHIDEGHGANGTTDQSMADINDVARMQYVIDNYDSIELLEGKSREFRDKAQQLAPMIRISKRVNGNYYVVEAVPDTNRKKLEIVTAYKNKASEQQALIMQAENSAPPVNVRNVATDNAYINSIPQSGDTVKGSIPENGQANTPRDLREVFGVKRNAETAQEMSRSDFEQNQSETSSARVKNVISVNTKNASELIKNMNAARRSFVEYTQQYFPASVINQSTQKEIGISRTGIDKFLSGNISKEKFASGYEIPKLIETAVKVGEAGDNKGRSGINGYEYYYNTLTIDGKEYAAHIRVRNTDMGDKYYGHTISNNVVDIEIEPMAWNSDENSSGHPINAVSSMSEDAAHREAIAANHATMPDTSGNVPSTTSSFNSIPQSGDTVKDSMPENRQANTPRDLREVFGVKRTAAQNDLSSEANVKRFAENVDKVFSGEMPQRAVVTIGDTPELLQRYGAATVPITINQSTMYKIAYPTGYFGAEKKGHNLGIPALKHLPEQIANPLAILKSNSQDNSLVLLTEWEDTQGNPVIIPMHLDKNGDIGIVNEIASAYGKKGFDSLLTDKEGNSTVLYTKNNEDIHRLAQSGLQLPGAPNEDTLINNSIPQSGDTVKGSMPGNGQANTPRDLREVFGLRRTAAQGDINAQTAQPKDMETIKREYAQAVDPNIVAFAQYAVSNPGDNKSAVWLGDVSRRQAADIKNLTGIDTKGFGAEAKANTFRHINERHGVNGIANQSMADINDVARMQYVIDNYDGMELLKTTSKEYKDKNQNRSPLIRLYKRVNGNYYIVEAVPDTNRKKVEIVTAYKKAAHQMENVQAHSSDVRNESDVTAYKNSIPQSGDTVKGSMPENGQANTPRDLREVFGLKRTAAQGDINAQTEAAPLQAGQVTKIKHPYSGTKPVQAKNTPQAASVIPDAAVETAKQEITSAADKESGKISRAAIKKAYEAKFDAAGGKKSIAVNGMTMDGEPYVVDVSKRAIGKVISDPNLSVEKLAVLEAMDDVIANGAYIDSGAFIQEGKKQKDTIRFDYFETPVKIAGKDYIASFDVEVFPGANNYRTHKIIEKMDLTPVTATDAGPEPAATETYRAADMGDIPTAAKAPSSPSENSIPQSGDTVKGSIPENGQANTPRDLREVFGLKGTAAQGDINAQTAQPKDMETIKREYAQAVDPNIVAFAQYAVSNPGDNKSAVWLGDVSRRQAADIKNLTGIDTKGFGAEAKANTFRHIDEGHGANGTTDQSMADINDVARIQYVIDNYDGMEKLENESREFLDKNQRKAPLVRLYKRVNGNYYVVEAVPDTNRKKLEIVTAYKNKASEQQSLIMQAENSAPPVNVRNVATDNAYINSIPQSGDTVKGSMPGNGQANTPRDLREVFGVKQTAAVQIDAQVKKDIAALSEGLGRRVEFYTDNSRPDKADANGFYENGVLYINENAENPLIEVFKHELFHSLDNADKQAVIDFFRENVNENTQAFRDYKYRTMQAYRRKNLRFSDADFWEEYTAQNAEFLFEEEYIRKMAEKDRGLVQRILEWIRSVLAKLKRPKDYSADVSSHESGRVSGLSDSQLEKAQRLYERALSGDTARPAEGERRYSIAGERAKGADLTALARAKEMRENGSSPQETFEQTGWFYGMDGKWRFEMDDSKAVFDQHGLRVDPLLLMLKDMDTEASAEISVRLEKARRTPMKLSEILQHEELYRAYPQLRDMRVKFVLFDSGRRGEHQSGSDTIRLNSLLSNEETLGTLLHEVQHVIQDIEGFEPGGSAERVLPLLRVRAERYLEEIGDSEYKALKESGDESAKNRYIDELIKQEYYAGTIEEAAYRAYRMLHGEQEAEQTSERRDMTAEERKGRYPGLHEALLLDDEAIPKSKGFAPRVYHDVAGRADESGRDSGIDDGVRYSVKYGGGKPVVVIEEDIFAGHEGEKPHKVIRDYIKNNYTGEFARILESGQKVYFGKDLPQEYAYSKYSRSLNSRLQKAKGQAAQNLNELVEIGTDRRWEKAEHAEKHRLDAKYGFYKYATRFQVNGEIYDADILIRNDADGKKYLYDVLSVKQEQNAEDSNRKAVHPDYRSAPDDISIPENAEKVNGNFEQNENNTAKEKIDIKNGERAGTSGIDDGVRYSVKTLPDGKKYVQADRQVITGDDPKVWENEVYQYINDKIRSGHDVKIPTNDGDVLTISEKTAWKMGYRNEVKNDDGTSRFMTDNEYRTKVNAAGHIDELSKISKRGKKNAADNKNHGFAQDGFNYRTAYFKDLDNQYYKMTISVGENSEQKTVYNIGRIERVPFPAFSGSKTSDNVASAKRNSSIDSISQETDAVNSSMPKSGEKNSLKLSKFYDSLQDADGQYYRLTLSVGKNGEVNTVYNIGKMKEAKNPARGSKAIGMDSETAGVSFFTDNRITQKEDAVKGILQENSGSAIKEDRGAGKNTIDIGSGERASVRRRDTAEEALRRFGESGDRADLPSDTWAQSYVRDAERSNIYLQNQIADAEFRRGGTRDAQEIAQLDEYIAKLKERKAEKEASYQVSKELKKALDDLHRIQREQEAEQTSERRDMTAEERKGRYPGLHEALLLDDEAIPKSKGFAPRAYHDVAGRAEESGRASGADDGVRYSVKYGGGKPVVVIEEDIFAGHEGEKPHKVIRDYIKNNYTGEFARILESGQKVYFGKDLPGEYTQSKNTRSLNRRSLRAKNQATQNLNELVEIGTDRRWEKAEHAEKHRLDAKYGFYKYATRFQINGKIYNADLLIRNDANGRKYLYDVLNPTEEGRASLSSSSQDGSDGIASTRPSDTSIPENAEKVNGNFGQNENGGNHSMQELFKASDAANEKFTSQVDGWLNRTLRTDELLELGQTPEVLKQIGAKDLPIVMNQNVLVKITGGKHTIALDEIKNLPNAISDPLMVFRSATVPNSFVILTELTDKSGNDIVAALHLNRMSGFNRINRIASVYGKENVGNFVTEQAAKGNLKYIDKNKSQEWSIRRGLQLPKLNTNPDSNNIILQKEDIVNNKSQGQLRSRGLQLPKLNTVLDSNNIILQKEDIVNSSMPKSGEKNSIDVKSSGVSEAVRKMQERAAEHKAEAEQKSRGRDLREIFGVKEGVSGTEYTGDFEKETYDEREKSIHSGLSSKEAKLDIPKHKKPELLEKLNKVDYNMITEKLDAYEREIVDSDIENAIVITQEGEVWRCRGTENMVFPDSDLGDKLKGAYVTHNHPDKWTEYSFSSEDLRFYIEKGIGVLRGCDKKFVYEFSRNAEDIDEYPENWMAPENYQHSCIIREAALNNIGYRRRKNE